MTCPVLNGLSESPLESCARVAFARRGLEPPELQVVIQTDESDFRVDFYWRKYRTVAEADGLLKYRDRKEGPARAIAQLRRDRLLRATGRDVVHFTWHELFYEEDELITRLTTSFTPPQGVIGLACQTVVACQTVSFASDMPVLGDGFDSKDGLACKEATGGGGEGRQRRG